MTPVNPLRLKIKLDAIALDEDYGIQWFDDKRKRDVKTLIDVLEQITTGLNGMNVASDASSLQELLKIMQQNYDGGRQTVLPKELTVQVINSRKKSIANALIQEIDQRSIRLPAGFLFGTATSAFQIETAGYHDWTGLRAMDGSILQTTIDHEQYRGSDASIISYLGNAYRCSLDWGRLQKGPYEEFDASVVAEYRGFLSTLKKSGLFLMITLHHYASPMWFTKKYTWAHPESVAIFKQYTEQMVKHFGDLCDAWITFNEGELLVIMGYIMGRYPPYKRSIIQAKKAITNIVASHNEAYTLLKRSLPQVPVGIAKSEMYYRGDNVLGSSVARVWNWIISTKVHRMFSNSDYLGINYYGKITFRPFPLIELESLGVLDKHGKKHDDMWEYAPVLFIRKMKQLWNAHHKPIYITENGCCTKDDNLRIRYIQAHLFAVKKAIADGVDIRSYFYWSTFDNFELASGMSYKFGLVEIDPTTKARTIRPSGHYYARLRTNNTEERTTNKPQ